jgi:hypothetical protein
MPQYLQGSLEELFAKQLNNPNDTMGQQYQYLRDMNRTPTMELGLDMNLDHEGNYQNWENKIKINPFAIHPERTLSHELQHAVSNMMGGQRYTTEKKGSSMNEDERRFVEGSKKLDKETNIPLGDLSRYRRSFNERQAFGVANSRYPDKDPYMGTPHLDATMATEQAILLDLAKRALKSDNAPAKEAPKTDPIDNTINSGSDKLKQLGTWAAKYFQK